MRNFIAFSGLVAVLVALVVVAAQVLKLPPIVTYIAVGLGALLIAVRAIVDALQHFRGGEARASDPAADARIIARREAKRRRRQLLQRFAAVKAALKAAQAPPRLRYRERGGAPWWLVVGPTGHGKSDLLRAAPDAQELAPPQEPDEPRFFLAAGAVFLELPEVSPPTAGPALAALFAALLRLRPRCPLSGVLVVQRADALLDPTALELRGARRQIDQAAAALSVQVPVLLVVSQLDRVAGLAELLDGLHPVRAPLGVSLPLREGKHSVHTAAVAGLGSADGIIEWVRQRCHALVARADPGTPRQTRLYGLWQQFTRIGNAAATVAAQLAHDPLPGGDPLRMRGIYFTCAHPEAFAPEDRWAANLAAGAGGHLVADLVQAPPLPPAFVADLFSVELTRAGLHATRLRRHLRRRFAASAALALGLTAVAAFTARGSTRAAQVNEELLQATLDSAVAVAQARDEQLAPVEQLDRLRGAAAAWRAPDAPNDAGWGLFRGDELDTLVTDAYQRAVCHAVLRPLTARMHRALRQFAIRHAGAGQAGSDAAREALDHLRAYLLLSSGGAATEPEPWGEAQSRWLLAHVEAAWTRADGDSDDPRRAAVLQAHVALLAAPAATADPEDPCARSGHARAVDRDDDLVRTVREILNRTPPDRDQVARMVERINRRTDLPTVSTRSLTTAHYLRSEVVVPAAFTRAGWTAFREALGVELDSGGDQSWVLGHTGVTESRVDRCTNLRKLYTDLHIKHWERFISSVTLASPTDLDEAAAIFKELSEEVPLTALFRAVVEHTQGLPPIPCNETREADLLARMLPRSAPVAATRATTDAGQVAVAFAKFVAFGAAPPAGKPGVVELDNYHKRLAELRTAIDKARENAAETPALAAAVTDAIADLKSAVQRGSFGAWKEKLQAILLPPLLGVDLLLSDSTLRAVHIEWCASVYTPLQRSVVGRYPFVAGSHTDAALVDLEALFHPQNGDIAKFRAQYLGAYFDLRGDTLEARERGTAVRHHITGRAVDFFDAAHKLGVLLYGGPGAAGAPAPTTGAGQPGGLDLGVLMHCHAIVHGFTLVVDGKSVEYDCATDQSKQIHWPATDGPPGAQVTAKGYASQDILKEPGEFGLLRLLERGNPVRRPHESAFEVAFDLPRLAAASQDRTRTVKLKATIKPRDLRGGNLFFGFGGARFLGPLRAPGFVNPPQVLVDDFSHACAPPP